jgi:hypothetical protein
MAMARVARRRREMAEAEAAIVAAVYWGELLVPIYKHGALVTNRVWRRKSCTVLVVDSSKNQKKKKADDME